MDNKQKAGFAIGAGAALIGIVALGKGSEPGIDPIVDPTGAYGRISRADNGNEIVGAKVSLAGRNFTSLAGGVFHFYNLPSGSHTLAVQADGFENTEVEVILREGLHNNLGHILLYLDLSVTTGSISGKLELITPSGDMLPIGVETVKVGFYSAQSNSNGFFNITDVPFGVYPTLEVDGYIPIPINLSVIGDMDLGVVEMALIGTEWGIVLVRIKLDGALAEGQDVLVSVYAALLISEFNVPVSRAISLWVNGTKLADKTIKLARNNPNFPSTEYFELATLHLADAGEYTFVVGDAAGTISRTVTVSSLPNLVTTEIPEEIHDNKILVQEYYDSNDQIYWICPICGKEIRITSCQSDCSLPDWRQVFAHGLTHNLSEQEHNEFKWHWKDYLEYRGKYLACKIYGDECRGLRKSENMNVNLKSCPVYYNGEELEYNPDFTTSDRQDLPHAGYSFAIWFVKNEDMTQLIEALYTRPLPGKRGFGSSGFDIFLGPNGEVPGYINYNPKNDINEYLSYRVPYPPIYSNSGLNPYHITDDQNHIIGHSYLSNMPSGNYTVLCASNYFEYLDTAFKNEASQVWIVGGAHIE